MSGWRSAALPLAILPLIFTHPKNLPNIKTLGFFEKYFFTDSVFPTFPVLLVALEVAATVSDVVDAVDEDDSVAVVDVVAVVAVVVVSCCSSFAFFKQP